MMDSARVSPLLPCLLLGLALTLPRSPVHSESPWNGDRQGSSTRYDFAVHVPAGKQECYFVPSSPGGDFFFTFEVQWTLGFQQENAVRAFVRSPSGRLEANLDERQRGTIEFQVTTEGTNSVQEISTCGSKSVLVGQLRVSVRMSFGIQQKLRLSAACQTFPRPFAQRSVCHDFAFGE
uniref:Transmembrane emp24 domain-containing protein 6-like n=1 Tax=Petromyzon marinus TaxID=7757 RepID=A0AAJ7SY41_PETMA|nr:transmembrane emp24 domain-containing protein 6-like [Petromyzon marinus]